MVGLLQPAVTYDELSSQLWALWKSPEAWRARVEVNFIDIELRSIEQAGSWTNPEIVQAYEDGLDEGCPIAPLVVSETERKTYYIHDGNHRSEGLLNHLGPEATVRVAVVAALDGYEFSRVDFPTFSTYLLLCKRQTGSARRHNALAKTLCYASVTVV